MSNNGFQFQHIIAAQSHARSWLFDKAAPLWASVGVCPDGQFAERLTLSGDRVEINRRLRVQARQIFSFLTIGELGWAGPWRDITGRALDILLSNGRSNDGHFVHQFDRTGAVVDTRRDLYDHAFGLFALGHAVRLLGRPDAEQAANDIMDRMDATWRRPEGGFWEGEITLCPPYRQNPHMHMFEAGLALYSATGQTRWKSLYEGLGELFRERFQDDATGAVTEYFDRNWQRLPGQQGAIVEPGHCLEWAWLFELSFGDSFGVDVAERLGGFARQYGICSERGVAINEVGLDGSVIDGNARLWPQTERLKAAVVRHIRIRSEVTEREVLAAYSGLVPYLGTPCPGVWYDRWLANGEWVMEAAPASSFYHIVCGLKELLNCPA